MEFLNFSIAKKLKEKGFPQVKENTIAMYDEDGEWYSMAETIGEAYSFNDFDEHDCVCPTISHALKWLRGEKFILIGLSPMQEYGGDEIVEWCATVYKAGKQGELSLQEKFYYQSYEQAAINGIEYALDNLI